MWLSRQMKPAIPTADADLGVTTIAGEQAGVVTRGEVRALPVYGPGGYAWLPENGYCVQAERLAADKGVIYPILTVTGGEMPPATPAQAQGGFLLGEDPLWGEYLAMRILRLRKAAAGLAQARDEALAEKRRGLLDVIDQLERQRDQLAAGTEKR